MCNDVQDANLHNLLQYASIICHEEYENEWMRSNSMSINMPIVMAQNEYKK